MRVLIIGASGFIGHYLQRRLIQESGFDVVSTYNSRAPEGVGQSWYQLEITDHHRLAQIFLEIKPEVVVLLAAIADVKTAEMGAERATQVNVDGARQVSRLCSRHNAKLVFLSSEYVFRGDRGSYQEDDSPDPNTHYGRTKWQAELAVADEASHWSIVRTSLVYGWPLAGRRNLATVIVDRLKNGETYEGDSGTYRTPIYVEHLTEGIIELVNHYHPGIFHLAGRDWMNMYQFGHAVAQASGLDSSLVKRVPVLVDLPSENTSSDGLDQAPRPDILGLDCTETSHRLGLPTFSVVDGLKEMLG